MTEDGRHALELGQERTVIANVVDYGQMLLVVRNAQSTTELLQPDYAGFCRSEHQDSVNRWNVYALVKYVDCKDYV